MSSKSEVSKLAIVGFVLSILLAPVGLVLSILALIQTNKGPRGGRGLALAGVIIGCLLTLPFVLLTWLIINASTPHPNQAEIQFQPIANDIKALGAIKICDNGDNGRGIDNQTPWYQVYYSAPDSSNVLQQITDLSAQQGVSLTSDKTRIEQLKTSSSFSGLPESDTYSPDSYYLTGVGTGKQLSVAIIRNSSVHLNCKPPNYGMIQKAGDNTAIIDVLFSISEQS